MKKNKHLEDERDRLIELVRRQEGEVLPDDVLRKIAGLEQELINSAKANEKLICVSPTRLDWTRRFHHAIDF